MAHKYPPAAPITGTPTSMERTTPMQESQLLKVCLLLAHFNPYGFPVSLGALHT